MQSPKLLHNNCVVNGCMACFLIDWAIDVLNWFDRRPSDFSSETAQKVLAKALLIKLSIEKEKGVLHKNA